MSRERREQERHPMQIQCKMTAETLSGMTPKIEFLTANISSGGAFITTSNPCLEFFLSLEDLKTLKFVLSKESLQEWKGERAWISATGIVIRHEPAGMAIIFDENYQICPMQANTEQEFLIDGPA